MEDFNISSKRKEEHINLALRSIVQAKDHRFNYEPVMSAMPTFPEEKEYMFLGFPMLAPIWISSMTGGTKKANLINERLAKACGKFGLGMGLGSCRSLLYEDYRLKDFDVKKFMQGQALFANLGIAQIENLVNDKALDRIPILLEKLDADGLIVHINPLQEWLQPEGDKISLPPYITIERLKESYGGKLIVKEVGQGMGPKSLKKLFDLKVDGLEFAALGGTNFSKMELLRSQDNEQFEPLASIGHSASEMVNLCNDLQSSGGSDTELIISGGINGFLDGYYAVSRSHLNAIYGQAGAFLKRAIIGQKELDDYIMMEISGWQISKAFLEINE